MRVIITTAFIFSSVIVTAGPPTDPFESLGKKYTAYTSSMMSLNDAFAKIDLVILHDKRVCFKMKKDAVADAAYQFNFNDDRRYDPDDLYFIKHIPVDPFRIKVVKSAELKYSNADHVEYSLKFDNVQSKVTGNQWKRVIHWHNNTPYINFETENIELESVNGCSQQKIERSQLEVLRYGTMYLRFQFSYKDFPLIGGTLDFSVDEIDDKANWYK